MSHVESTDTHKSEIFSAELRTQTIACRIVEALMGPCCVCLEWGGGSREIASAGQKTTMTANQVSAATASAQWGRQKCGRWLTLRPVC